LKQKPTDPGRKAHSPKSFDERPYLKGKPGTTAGRLYRYRVKASKNGQLSGSSNEVLVFTPVGGVCNVTAGSDDGSGSTGTLSAALNAACSSISFDLSGSNNILTITNPLPPVPVGVVIGGRCGASGPAIVIRGGAGLAPNVTGLVLSGINWLFGVRIEKFSGVQVKSIGGGNKLSCIVAAKQ